MNDVKLSRFNRYWVLRLEFFFHRYLNLGSYKKNPNHQNANPVQKNGSNQSPVMPSTSMKSKNEKVDDPDKAKRTYLYIEFVLFNFFNFYYLCKKGHIARASGSHLSLADTLAATVQ